VKADKSITKKRADISAPRRSLVSCLETLGIRDIRASYRRDGKYHPHSSGSKTIYNRYSLWQIEDMAEKHYKEALIRNHPDRGGDEEFCKKIGQAIGHIRKLIAHRRGLGLY